MAVETVVVNGASYPVAPLEPESHQYPTPAFPMAVTPEVAEEWLGHNWRNRNQREAGKRDYSSDMAEGNFAINGTTITFSRPLAEGEDPDIPPGTPVLMDGQHRLEACVRSGKPFVTYVAWGLDPAVRPTIDSGIKRTFGDVLSMQGSTNALVLASVVRKTHAWENGDFHLTMRRVPATNTQLGEFLNEHPELRRSAQIAARTHQDFQMSTGHGLRQSVLGLAHYLLMKADETRAPEFFARLGDGAEMTVSHPLMALRRRLVSDSARKQVRRDVSNVPDWQQMCYYIRTWNAFMLWEVSTEEERERFPRYSLVGRMDSQRMPKIRTLDGFAEQGEFDDEEIEDGSEQASA